jgi:hypothetical protein
LWRSFCNNTWKWMSSISCRVAQCMHQSWVTTLHMLLYMFHFSMLGAQISASIRMSALPHLLKQFVQKVHHNSHHQVWTVGQLSSRCNLQILKLELPVTCVLLGWHGMHYLCVWLPMSWTTNCPLRM